MPSDQVRGACPSVHEPFAELDGALVRVRLPGGRVPVAAARELAAIAGRAGAGPFELTNRANLQLRGIPAHAVAPVRDALVSAGITPAEPTADARRNVLASPTAGVDPCELLDTRPLVDALAARLAVSPVAPASPKFGVLVDGGGAVHVRGRRHDIALGAVRTAAGALVYEVALGAPLPLTREPDAAVRVVQPERVIDLLDAVLAGGDGDDILEALPATDLATMLAPSVPAVGVHPQRAPGRVWIGAVAVVGRLDPATLDAVAALAGDELRITPRRGVVLVDVPTADAERTVAALHDLGLVTDAADPATIVVACAGDRGCAAGLADVQADARELVERLRTVPVARRPRSVHVSGCEKGCARVAPAGCSLVAGPERGRYELYAGGRDGHPRFGMRRRRGLDRAAALAAVLAEPAP